jgi:hypothetical protein
MASGEQELLLSRHFEWRFIRLCIEESLLDIDPIWQIEMQPALQSASLTPADKSHLLSSIFIRPHIQVRRPSTSAVRGIRSKFLKIENPNETLDPPQFSDVNLLCSYANALHGVVPLEALQSRLKNGAQAEADVERLFGDIPPTDGDGKPVFLQDILTSAVTRAPRPSFSEEQLSAFERYRVAKGSVSGFLSCYSDIEDMWKYRREGTAIALHPGTKTDYASIVIPAALSFDSRRFAGLPGQPCQRGQSAGFGG